MKECIICGKKINNKDIICSKCGFYTGKASEFDSLNRIDFMLLNAIYNRAMGICSDGEFQAESKINKPAIANANLNKKDYRIGSNFQQTIKTDLADNYKQHLILEQIKKVFLADNYKYESNLEQTKITIMADNYKFDINTGTIIKYLGSEKECVIPKTINGRTVKCIGPCAFAGLWWLKKVKIPSTVNVIEQWAFFECKALEVVEIPKSVIKIKSHAFSSCTSLEKIKLPAEIISIDIDAFAGSDKLSILCKQGSYAQEYAIKYGYIYYLHMR